MDVFNLAFKRIYKVALPALVFAIGSIGCSGGGGGSSLPIGSSNLGSFSGTPPPTQLKSGAIAFSYLVPASGVKTLSIKGQSSFRPLYVSSSTFQASLVVTPQGLVGQAPQILPCTAGPSGGKTCSGTLSAPVGIDSIAVTLEDQPALTGGHGKPLSQGTVVAVVNAGQTSNIHATLDGVVHNVGLIFATPTVAYAPSLPYDAASQGVQTVASYVIVNALDADGNVITYNGGYVDDVGNNVSIGLSSSTLCNGNVKCSVTIGVSSVSGPGAVIPVTAKLDDSVSSFSEPLTVTPAILFGSPTGSLTPGTLAFVRPTSCSAYLPKYLPTDFDMTVSGKQIVIKDTATLDSRLALAAQVEFDSDVQGNNFPVGFVAPSFGTSSATFSPTIGSVSTLSATYSATTPASLTIQSSLTPPTTVNASIAVIGDGSLCTGATNPAFLAGVTKRSGIKTIVISGVFTEYRIPGINQVTAGITSNPDGNLYVTAQNPDAIYKSTISGILQSFATPSIGTTNRFPGAITTGPDGALWYGHQQNSGPIGRMTTSGLFTDYNVPSSGNGTIDGITIGPDNNVWYTNPNGIIGKITSAGQSTEYPLPRGTSSVPAGIVTGSDGNLWVAEQGGTNPAYIAKVTPQGVVTEFALPNGPCPVMPGPIMPGPFPPPTGLCPANTRQIALGPDGALWLTDAINGIDRVTTGGQVSTYPLANSAQVGKITRGPDGNMWFAHGNLIGVITMSGAISEKPTPSGIYVQGITTGPDNAIWYVGGNVIGNIK